MTYQIHSLPPSFNPHHATSLVKPWLPVDCTFDVTGRRSVNPGWWRVWPMNWNLRKEYVNVTTMYWQIWTTYSYSTIQQSSEIKTENSCLSDHRRLNFKKQKDGWNKRASSLSVIKSSIYAIKKKLLARNQRRKKVRSQTQAASWSQFGRTAIDSLPSCLRCRKFLTSVLMRSLNLSRSRLRSAREPINKFRQIPAAATELSMPSCIGLCRRIIFCTSDSGLG